MRPGGGLARLSLRPALTPQRCRLFQPTHHLLDFIFRSAICSCEGHLWIHKCSHTLDAEPIICLSWHSYGVEPLTSWFVFTLERRNYLHMPSLRGRHPASDRLSSATTSDGRCLCLFDLLGSRLDVKRQTTAHGPSCMRLSLADTRPGVIMALRKPLP